MTIGSVLAAIALLAGGCIFSGTFIITEPIEFSAHDDFYFYQIDLTDNAAWKKHGNKIDKIDAVGVELYITNENNSTFNAYVDSYSGPSSNPTAVPGDAITVIDSLALPAGPSVITYKESLKIITGLDELKTLVKKGMFDFYATSSSLVGTEFVIDSGKVIVTFSAND
jgi:hypothetical protein